RAPPWSPARSASTWTSSRSPRTSAVVTRPTRRCWSYTPRRPRCRRRRWRQGSGWPARRRSWPRPPRGYPDLVLERLEGLEREFAEVEGLLGDPEVVADQSKLIPLS